MADIRCSFCGAEPSDEKDDCFVHDAPTGACICLQCTLDVLRAVRGWMAGKFEYESWKGHERV